MIKKELLQKTNSLILCLTAHPDNKLNSEFADRIDDLIEMEEHFKNLKD